jgi:hypothetical protein
MEAGAVEADFLLDAAIAIIAAANERASRFSAERG